MMTKILLRLLLVLFPFCAPVPASADLLTSADVPLVPKPDAEVVAFGLQATRIQADQKLPITTLDVLAGQRKLSRFSPADQAYVRDEFQKYGASPPLYAKSISQSTTKSALPHDLSVQGPQEPEIAFVLHPYLEITPNALPVKSAKNDITAYGQPVNANGLRFAEFFRSLSPKQKMSLLHSSPLAIGDLSLNQRLFVSDLWQASSHPECAKFCSLPDTKITVGFSLEAVVTQTYQSAFITSHVQLPQPAPGRDLFMFNNAEGQQGQVWMRF